MLSQRISEFVSFYALATIKFMKQAYGAQRLLRALRTFYVEDAAKLSLPLVALPRSR
jgi:hypothetical protein